MKNRSKTWKEKNEPKEKMILATALPCVLLTLHLYFKTYGQDWGVVLVYASIAVEPGTKIIDSFCREGERRDVDKYNGEILLTTTVCVSTGWTWRRQTTLYFSTPCGWWMTRCKLLQGCIVLAKSGRRIWLCCIPTEIRPSKVSSRGSRHVLKLWKWRGTLPQVRWRPSNAG